MTMMGWRMAENLLNTLSRSMSFAEKRLSNIESSIATERLRSLVIMRITSTRGRLRIHLAP